METLRFLLLVYCSWVISASTIVVDKVTRDEYISAARSLLTTDIGRKDMFNGPPNPYKLDTFQTLNCTFVEPSAEDPIGGTTPKFLCRFQFNGEDVDLLYAPVVNNNITTTRAGTSTTTTSSSTTSSKPSFVSQSDVQSLVEMGFNKDEAINALTKSRGDMGRALELLTEES